MANWLPEEVRGGRIGTVRVENATISSTQVRGKAVTRDSSTQLNLSMRGLQLDSARHRIFERATLSVGALLHSGPAGEDSLVVRAAEVTITPDDTAFSIAEVRTGPAGGEHSLRMHGIRRSHARLMLTLDSVTYAPDCPDSAFFRQAPPRSTRVRLKASGIEVLGLRQANLRRRRLTAGGIWVAQASLEVLADRRGSRPAGARGGRQGRRGRRHPLWPARLASLDWVVGTDSAIIDSATIRYAEWPRGVPRPASVLFDRVHLRLLRATNDSSVTDRLPLIIEGRGRLLGSAPFRATLQVRVGPEPLRLRMEGEIGSMPLAGFNSWSLPGSGVEVTDGTLDHTRFWFVTDRGRSTGRLRAQWRDLSLRLVDPATGRQDLRQKLRSIVARTLSRDDNLPDDDGRLQDEAIDYTVVPSDTFWGLIWRSLRSGLVRAVWG